MARAPSIDSEAISQIINETVIPPLKKEQFAEKLVVAHPEIPEPELVHSDMSSIIKDDTAKVSPGVVDPSQPIAYVAVAEELLEEHFESELVGEPVKKVAQESIDKFISFKDKFQQVTVIDVEKDHNLTKDHDLSEESPYKYGG